MDLRRAYLPDGGGAQSGAAFFDVDVKLYVAAAVLAGDLCAAVQKTAAEAVKLQAGDALAAALAGLHELLEDAVKGGFGIALGGGSGGNARLVGKLGALGAWSVDKFGL